MLDDKSPKDIAHALRNRVAAAVVAVDGWSQQDLQTVLTAAQMLEDFEWTLEELTGRHKEVTWNDDSP